MTAPVRTVAQLLPFRSTNPDGVGDYAALLATDLKSRHAINSHFLVGRPDRASPFPDDGFPTTALSARSAEALARALLGLGEQVDTLILHLSGYGYHRFGAPLFIAKGLDLWRAAQPRARVITIFHELFVDGPIFDRRFWYGLAQKAAVKSIARRSDAHITPCDSYADWLERRTTATAVERAPVFSTIGEARNPSTARADRIAIFARGAMAEAAYHTHRRALEECVEAFGISEIIDIGARSRPVPDSVSCAKVISFGRLPGPEICALLGTCRFGFLPYQDMPIGKSTLFAAYAWHGVIPICVGRTPSTGDGVEVGRDFLHSGPQGLSGHLSKDDESRMRQAVMSWYKGHRLSAQSDRMAQLLLRGPDNVEMGL